MGASGAILTPPPASALNRGIRRGVEPHHCRPLLRKWGVHHTCRPSRPSVSPGISPRRLSEARGTGRLVPAPEQRWSSRRLRPRRCVSTRHKHPLGDRRGRGARTCRRRPGRSRRRVRSLEGTTLEEAIGERDDSGSRGRRLVDETARRDGPGFPVCSVHSITGCSPLASPPEKSSIGGGRGGYRDTGLPVPMRPRGA